MLSTEVPHCDCCGLPIDFQSGEDCPRCGYPVQIAKEERFLAASLRDLKRVALHGGATTTVAQLIQHYQSRLYHLQHLHFTTRQSLPVAPIPVATAHVHSPMPVHSSGVMPSATSWSTATPAGPFAQTQQPSARVFSLRSFFADQTINIVASLGAFLILIGSLSFVATTTNLFLSFLIIAVVHAVFGMTGIVSYRFQSFRIVAIIYTAIFALLVPLVGFAGYRLVADQHILLAPATIVAIAAIYAALVYAALAVYQKFTPFGYLAVAALAVADLAFSIALQLNSWWWPAMLMLLALPSLLSMARHTTNNRLFVRTWVRLGDPVRALMFTCVAICSASIVITFGYSLVSDALGHPLQEVRLAIASMALLLLCWLCVLVWLRQATRWALAMPYMFLLCVLVVSYVFHLQQLGYAGVLTAVAWLYHLLTRHTSFIQRFIGTLSSHMEALALLLVASVPFVVAPLLPLQLLEQAYHLPWQTAYVTSNTLVPNILILIAACVLPISMLLGHTGLRRVPDKTQASWYWLLLLSGFILHCTYSLLLLSLHAELVWWFLGEAIVFVTLTIAVRCQVNVAWANPLDVLALASVLQTLLVGWEQQSIIALLLFFAALSYGVVLYQRRHHWLFLPLTFFMLTLLPYAFIRPHVLLIGSIVLPLASVLIRRLGPEPWSVSDSAFPASAVQSRLIRWISWEWPLLVSGLLYGLLLCLLAITAGTSTVQNWRHVSFPVALEIGALALVWYVAAALGRIKWWLFAAVGFAVAALLMPGTSFWVLLGLAPTFAIAALVASRLADREWALPFYLLTGLAAIMMGITAFSQGHLLAATWALLLLAIIVYLVGTVQNEPVVMWVAPCFAVWSLYYSGLLGDFYRFPLVALLCVLIGLSIGDLRYMVPAFNRSVPYNRHLRYALPWYATALASAILTVIPLSARWNINYPFFAAIPIVLLVYALVTYVVMLIERVPEALVLPALLAAWAIALLPWMFWQHMLAYSALCVLIFCSQFAWRWISPATDWLAPRRWYTLLALGGQILVVLTILLRGSLFVAGTLAHVGAGSLFILAGLLFCSGYVQPSKELRLWCLYSAGLLVSLVVSWELIALGQTAIDVLTLAPATYLIVVAPFLSRNETLAQQHQASQICASIGATLLLLPTLWLSFGQNNLQPMLLLAAESLALLLLGITTRMRVFVLSGAALVMLSAIHALFLPSLGLPTSVALAILGGMLLAVATGLSLARHRLQSAWTHWE